MGAPLAWVLQELIDTSLAGLACYPRDVPPTEPLSAGLVTCLYTLR
jgi:hypothetical protein